MAVAMEAAPVEAAVETAEDVASDALRLQMFYWTLYIENMQGVPKKIRKWKRSSQIKK